MCVCAYVYKYLPTHSRLMFPSNTSGNWKIHLKKQRRKFTAIFLSSKVHTHLQHGCMPILSPLQVRGLRTGVDHRPKGHDVGLDATL